ncbi:hypothetical protein DFH11DRAFT_1687445 [Phellopilus nigrolimitatus]|nr:hypothetical protein DFH11DRAFT_1687445 [Phellopilus nigrolimitatus]
MAANTANARNLDDSRKQAADACDSVALHALIASLAPDGSKDHGKLSGQQVDALSERLDLILGDPGAGGSSAERRNEAGQLLNEEGLPIIDIAEPVNDTGAAAAAAAETEQKLAARAMQKKMGKALLQNVVAQREREAARKLEEEAAAAARAPGPAQNGRARPRKSVSFADVPEPRPPVAWGDVSIGALRAGLPKARLRVDVHDKQPLRLEVVERVPGDSDDESNPEEHRDAGSDDDDEENTPPLDGDFDSDSSRAHGTATDDEIDFSQARLQREVALEYIRLRGSIGAEAHKAMTEHTHEGEDEWDHPEVPLEATLSSRPAKPNMSRFKAMRQSSSSLPNGQSVSLGGSVLPQGKTNTLQRAVRTGKLDDGKLVGGEEGESASEDEENENYKHMLDMLKAGIVAEEEAIASVLLSALPEHSARDGPVSVPQTASSSSAAPTPLTSYTPPPKKSRFLSERTAQSTIASPPAPDAYSPLSSTVFERSKEAPRPTSASQQSPAGKSRQAQDVTSGTPFKRPPSVISVPSIRPSQRQPVASQQSTPDPTVLPSMVIESPSFPPPRIGASSTPRPPALVNEVRESTRRGLESTQSQPGRVSRFKAERM